MDNETQGICEHGGMLIVERIIKALHDKPAGTMYETYARKGRGTEAENLIDLLKKYVVAPPGYGIHQIRVVGDGWHAVIVGIRL